MSEFAGFKNIYMSKCKKKKKGGGVKALAEFKLRMQGIYLRAPLGLSLIILILLPELIITTVLNVKVATINMTTKYIEN